ncbi:DUF5712 family protein [Parabacteroides johnsonii]|uniref:DUF5712 family protein n=1 Tax=Parabacteroides johnsonii TaxID=387661 RepID=UPI0018987F31|nr:DUF5712 family protein [Parabacteroides johnsonii]
MHIDFAPPSGGTYNNAGSSRQLASYMEHEDLERMEKGIYTDGFFNLTEDNIYKSKVIKDIDTNIGQLLKTDAKFFAIHVSPSESELRAMGNTEQEKAEAVKRYVREVFIPEYAKNFNKGLSEADIKFYGKIHFDRSRSNNELNMHCHLIVSRKDQTNKKKLSPLTNHKNTMNGVIKGGFDRVNLFRQAGQGFDKLFSYNRQLSESFEYSNTMKNGSIDDKLRMQEQELKEPKYYFTGEKKKDVFQSSEKENNISCNLDNKADEKHSYSHQNNGSGDSLLSIISLGKGNNYDAASEEELQTQKRKKKKGIRR